MCTIGLPSRYLTRPTNGWCKAAMVHTVPGTGGPTRAASRCASSSAPAVVQPLAPIFNRREKRKLRNHFPRPDRLPSVLYPAVPASFVNRVTMADGSSFYVTTRSPRSTITLARDVTNHPLWNPSLAREVADQDQSGRMGRFARRYGGSKVENTMAATSADDMSDPSTSSNPDPSSSPTPTQNQPINQNQTNLNKNGFGVEDLEWMSGESNQSFYGIGNAKNIKGLKKSSTAGSKK